MVTGTSRSESGVADPYSSSDNEMCAVLGDGDSVRASMSFALPLPYCEVDNGRSGSETSGKSWPSMRVIDARWDPASTAITEFLAQFVAIDRTRKPVTLSSLGPPPEPCSC
jgi:hypothetical protein